MIQSIRPDRIMRYHILFLLHIIQMQRVTIIYKTVLNQCREGNGSPSLLDRYICYLIVEQDNCSDLMITIT